MRAEEVIEIIDLQRELYAIEKALLKVVFRRHRRIMKPLDIMEADSYVSGKDRGFYMSFLRECYEGAPRSEDELTILFEPCMMLNCSQDRKINIVYHELIHYFCYLKEIKDTQGHFHNEYFKEEARANMGDSDYSNDIDGYNEAYLLPEALEKVKNELKLMEERGELWFLKKKA